MHGSRVDATKIPQTIDLPLPGAQAGRTIDATLLVLAVTVQSTNLTHDVSWKYGNKDCSSPNVPASFFVVPHLQRDM